MKQSEAVLVVRHKVDTSVWTFLFMLYVGWSIGERLWPEVDLDDIDCVQLEAL